MPDIKILLITIHPAKSTQSVPLATAFLKSNCIDSLSDKQAVEIETVDYYLQIHDSRFMADDIARRNADVAGFSIYLWNRKSCQEVATILKAKAPDTILFAGGPEATADTQNILKTRLFNFIIHGEGELPFAELCNNLVSNLEICKIPGVATLDEQSNLRLLKSFHPTDINQLPSPWLDGTLNPSDYDGILWQLARGCSFACDFCFDSRDRNPVRRFSMERIEAELKLFVKKNVTQVFVLDSTFNQDLPRAKAILKLIKKNAPDIHFHFEVRSEFIDHELAKLFSRITCSLQIGLQSGNPEVLKKVGRTFNRSDFVKRVMLLNDTGATFGFDLIYGLPGETLASFSNSLDFAISLYPNHLDIFPLAILPGTALAGKAKSIGIRRLNEPPYTVIATKEMNGEDLLKAENLANACDIFYTRGKAVAWFNAMLEAQALLPSQFFRMFADWIKSNENLSGINKNNSDSILKEQELDDETIWQLQRKFLKTLFSHKPLLKLLPVLLDLVDYHYHYAASLMTPVPKPVNLKRRGNSLLKCHFHLADAPRLARFSHEILELIDVGGINLSFFASKFKPVGSCAVIYPSHEGVATESLAEPFFRLLEKLDGTITLSEIATEVGLSKDEATDFIEFACAEGIVYPLSDCKTGAIF